MSKNKLFFVSAILFFVCSTLFYKVLFSDYIFLTQDSISAKSVRHGIELSADKFKEYPTWMPWMFGGLPSTHSMQNVSEYYYPHRLTSVIKLFSLPWFWNSFIHFMFAGIGMYLLLKRIKLDFFPSLFGAIAFIMMPWMVTMIVHGHGSQVMTAAYIPWVLWALIKVKENADCKSIAILSLLIGLQLQRAHVQIAYYTWMLIGVYIIYDIVLSYIDKKGYDLKFIFRWILSSIIGFGMSVWIYIPLLNYAPFSKRSVSGGGASFDYATSWSLHPYETLSLLLPSSFGFGELTYFGYMPMTNFPNYSGVLIIFMSLFAFYKSSRKINYFFLSVIVLSLLISFGKYIPVYEFLYNWLPYFNKFRVPSMILILFQFSLSVLSAVGLSNLFKRIELKDNSIMKIALAFLFFILFLAISRYLFHDFSSAVDQRVSTNQIREGMLFNDILFIGIFISLACASIYLLMKGKIRSNLFFPIVIALCYCDLYLVDSKIINPDKDITYAQDVPMKKSSYLENHFDHKNDEVISFLNKDKTIFRVFSASIGSQGMRPEHNNNRLTAFNIESINGYHPAKLSNFESFQSVPLFNKFKMLNVKYFILSSKIDHPSLKLVKTGSYYSNLSYKIAHVYEYVDFEPRVQFLEKINKVDNKLEGYKRLNANLFDLRKDSFVSKDDYENSPLVAFSPLSSVSIKELTPNKVLIEVDAKSDSSGQHFVLLSEIFFPLGWEITGAPNLEILEVNNLFRGFFVPDGESEILLEFKPQDLRYSSMLTHFSLLLIILLFILPIIYRKNEKF